MSEPSDEPHKAVHLVSNTGFPACPSGSLTPQLLRDLIQPSVSQESCSPLGFLQPLPAGPQSPSWAPQGSFSISEEASLLLGGTSPLSQCPQARPVQTRSTCSGLSSGASQEADILSEAPPSKCPSPSKFPNCSLFANNRTCFSQLSRIPLGLYLQPLPFCLHLSPWLKCSIPLAPGCHSLL